MPPETTATPRFEPLVDAALIAALHAVDPIGLGGVSLRGYAGPTRENWLTALREMLPAEGSWRRLPLGISDERLLGGLDLTATLKLGRPIAQRGVLAEADGGTIVVAMAERMSVTTAARIAAVIDRGSVALARDGLSGEEQTAFGIVALDEGLEPDERPPEALLDRLAFRIDLGRLPPTADLPPIHDRRAVAEARDLLPSVAVTDALFEALATAAQNFGINSMRAVRFAICAARASAALDGRTEIEHDDAALAARLVLGPRATQMPSASEAPAAPDEPPPESMGEESGAEAPDAGDDDAAADKPLAETVTEAVVAALPSGLLAGLVAASTPSRGGAGQGRSDQTRKSSERGRPIGSRKGELRACARLALLDTLRAAAPWQRLRRATLGNSGAVRPAILVRADDFRVVRFKQRIRTTTIFVVDASGSSALHRLAEAKGAVETLLADCYVRRDEVALIAFRGQSAELLLPPTRSLTRTRRSLAQLPGGGGTPLAAGLKAAYDLATAIRRKGDSAMLVFLTDGQANVALDGRGSRAQAGEDVAVVARLVAAARLPGLVIDTSPRPQAKARQLAEAMTLRYLAMPTANPGLISAMVQAAA
ncbi:MAG: magnesium chelatase subunit D [Beijerinckiaceae bacterium]|nr:magnesium chelatase subunit D [Beijerinckiaceae bacterium]